MTKNTHEPDAISYLAGFGLMALSCLIGYAGWQIFKVAVNAVIEPRTYITDCYLTADNSGGVVMNGSRVSLNLCDPF